MQNYEVWKKITCFQKWIPFWNDFIPLGIFLEMYFPLAEKNVPNLISYDVHCACIFYVSPKVNNVVFCLVNTKVSIFQKD